MKSDRCNFLITRASESQDTGMQNSVPLSELILRLKILFSQLCSIKKKKKKLILLTVGEKPNFVTWPPSHSKITEDDYCTGRGNM